jgi:hypothetical protein
MTQKMIGLAGIAMVAGLAAGCASNDPHAGITDATHEWVPTDRVAKVNFNDNNASCAQAAGSVAAYETCMRDRGYQLHTP